MSEKIEIPDPIVFPEGSAPLPPIPAGSREKAKTQLLVRLVRPEDKDFGALLFNIVVGILAFVIMSGVGQKVSTHPMVSVVIPLGLVLVLAIMNSHLMFVEVDSQEAVVFIDMIFSSRQIIYMQGGHFTRITSRRQLGTISFKKEKISATIAGKNPVSFQTKNGQETEVDLDIFFRRRDETEALEKSLRYELEELKARIMLYVISNLSALGGRNTYESIRYYDTDVRHWVANLFAGEGLISPFEDDTGTEVFNPILGNVDLTLESKKIFAARAETDQIVENTRRLAAIEGVSAKDALQAAQAAQGTITKTVHTYEGLEGASVIALGADGIAAAIAGKKGK